ncbi:MAG TPA: pilus assembly protein FimV, partial [Planctomycetaceae bacterium]|nr:pilus assembly protein FimV [Planctomycetaceae bacterium]
MGHAVGLGEISTYSALNQPLNAQIEMVSTSPDEVGGITVKLAPESVFEQVGITRSPVLNHLRFKPAVVNGTPVIKVSSDRPIQEPFVNFIVEVSWPKG